MITELNPDIAYRDEMENNDLESDEEEKTN
jgi:hypothetical protein